MDAQFLFIQPNHEALQMQCSFKDGVLTLCLDDNPSINIISFHITENTMITLNTMNQIHLEAEDFSFNLESTDSTLIQKWLQLLSQSKDNLVSLNDFEFINPIGSGTYGIVSKVINKKSNQIYALKKISKSPKNQMIYETESYTLRCLNHTQIVKLIHSFETSENCFICLEYIEGSTLLSRLLQPQISLGEVQRYIVDIAHALEHIHSRGFCYLDLKPENVILTVDGHIKLVDFGCSKKINEKRKNLCGTLAYLAPEILEEKEYGIEVDYWALGVLVFQLVFGRLPFCATEESRLRQKICKQNVLIPAHNNESIRHLIKGLLEKDPAKRFGFSYLKNHIFIKELFSCENESNFAKQVFVGY